MGATWVTRRIERVAMQYPRDAGNAGNAWLKRILLAYSKKRVVSSLLIVWAMQYPRDPARAGNVVLVFNDCKCFAWMRGHERRRG
jgi:hypothetical protein